MIQTIAVIGAGPIGRGIAHAAASGGYRTILEDILPASLRRAQGEIRNSLETGIERGVLTRADAEAIGSRIEYAGNIDYAAREADLVIEAVPEEMESKLEIFTLLDRTCRPNTILASNTWALSITDIASITYRSQNIVGMRFSQPVEAMEKLEVVQALGTSPETLAAVVEVGRRMGKIVVIVPEFPPHNSESNAARPLIG
ncbi:MAG TPA: 3-hydroxyacyl-CoA dehydrogenase NAD-binding domain-containing protein [Terriglobales bacterium]|nr:3-hydroxyacyl-CoA dehydrogenase NAD-binding domain-containing protein [Terriglobales bacterium]